MSGGGYISAGGLSVPSFGNILPVSIGDFPTTVNTPTIQAAGAMTLIRAPGAAGGHIHARMKTVPSTPYCVRLAFMTQTLDNNCRFGFYWSDGTKYHEIGIAGQSVYISNRFWSTKDSSDGFVPNAGSPKDWHYSDVIWIECADNGTNRIVRFSNSGVPGSFFEYQQISRTLDLTPTQIGLGISQAGATFDTGAYFISWQQFNTATPTT